MHVMGIALDTRTGSPIVVLNNKDGAKALPIWIGSAEASAIIRQLENIKTARPMTHDLICNMIKSFGGIVSKIEINDVNSETYYATIFIEKENGEVIEIDARPSDAIAISLRVDASIFVSEKVVIDGTISTDEEKEMEDAEEFKNFVKDLKPSDFQKLLENNEELDQ